MAAKELARTIRRTGPSQFTASYLRQSPVLAFLAPLTTIRSASGISKGKKKDSREAPTKSKKAKANFHRDDIKDALQFSLCDAMR